MAGECQAKESDDCASARPSLLELVDASTPSLAAYGGFGFFLSWVWLGLYKGFPAFPDGVVDIASVVLLMGSFSIGLACVALGKPKGVRLLLRTWKALLAAALVSTLGSALAAMFTSADVMHVDPFVSAAFKHVGIVLMGLGTSVLLEGFALFFSRMKVSSALLAFCLSFIAAFFSFFWVNSTGFPLSCVLFSIFPLVCALSLKLSFANLENYACEVEVENPRYAHGFVRMLVAFGVFSFAAGMTQSFEPLKDFALAVDEGVICFSFVLVLVVGLTLSQRFKVGTFAVLKVLYQVAAVMLVLKFILQPLASDNLFFAALNVVGYFILFMVMWQLSAFVGHTNDLHPSKVFALVFGVAALCMGCGWVLGTLLYGTFGHDRYFISIAIGCVVAMFCTVGFSLRDFPRLVVSGKGMEKMARRKAEQEAGAQGDPTSVIVSTDMVIDRICEENKLSRREQEIFSMLVRGVNAENIASELVISYYTVRTHIRNIYGKLGVNSRSALFLLVAQREKDIAAGFGSVGSAEDDSRSNDSGGNHDIAS